MPLLMQHSGKDESICPAKREFRHHGQFMQEPALPHTIPGHGQ